MKKKKKLTIPKPRKKKERKFNPVKFQNRMLADPRFIQAVSKGMEKGLVVDEENTDLFNERRDKLAFQYTMAGKEKLNLPDNICDLIFQAFCVGYTQRYVDTSKLKGKESEATEPANHGDGTTESGALPGHVDSSGSGV